MQHMRSAGMYIFAVIMASYYFIHVALDIIFEMMLRCSMLTVAKKAGIAPRRIECVTVKSNISALFPYNHTESEIKNLHENPEDSLIIPLPAYHPSPSKPPPPPSYPQRPPSAAPPPHQAHSEASTYPSKSSPLQLIPAHQT